MIETQEQALAVARKAERDNAVAVLLSDFPSEGGRVSRTILVKLVEAAFDSGAAFADADKSEGK